MKFLIGGLIPDWVLFQTVFEAKMATDDDDDDDDDDEMMLMMMMMMMMESHG